VNIVRRLRLDAIVVPGRKRACKVVETYRKTGEKLDGLRVVFVKETITGLTLGGLKHWTLRTVVWDLWGLAGNMVTWQFQADLTTS